MRKEKLLTRATIFMMLILVFGCNTDVNITQNFKQLNLNDSEQAYWYAGEAELTSYRLEQARYGETHEGHAVLVFVTEPFNLAANTKADNSEEADLSVMKLVFTKKFTTGIYPYSMMTTSFFPFEQGEHSVKVSTSSQEWCGHTYMELQNRGRFDVRVSSYFEGESAHSVGLPLSLLEDDIWTRIRLNPDSLPIGEETMVPSFFYLRLMHQPFKAYACEQSLVEVNDSVQRYTVSYPALDRSLEIDFEADFPHRILGWEERYFSGWGEERQALTSKGTMVTTIQTDYWNKNGKNDRGWRDSLALPQLKQ